LGLYLGPRVLLGTYGITTPQESAFRGRHASIFGVVRTGFEPPTLGSGSRRSYVA
jgi:hypothetical protein